MLSDEIINRDLREAPHSHYCADEDCHEFLTARQIYNTRSVFWRKKNGNDKREYLINLIRLTQITVNNHSYHSVEGVTVCRLFWCKGVLHTSPSTYERCLAIYNRNILELPPSPYNKLGVRGSIALAFQQKYVADQGDVNPAHGKTILPAGVNRHLIYEEYLKQEGANNPVSESRFLQVWRQHMQKSVSFCSLGKIVRCAICTGAESRIPLETDPVLKTAMKEEYHKHLEKQR